MKESIYYYYFLFFFVLLSFFFVSSFSLYIYMYVCVTLPVFYRQFECKKILRYEWTRQQEKEKEKKKVWAGRCKDRKRNDKKENKTKS